MRRGEKILVTGGMGFIGSTLVNKLVDLGYEIHVADDLSRGSLENIRADVLNKIDFIKTDLTRLDNCIKVSRGIDSIFHLAASVGGIHYIKKKNVEGSTPSILMNTNMLEAARINDVDRFFFASSACVYHERTSSLNRFKESDAYPANPATTYGWVKLLGEIQCQAYYRDYGIKTSSARIFNAYGENENIDAGSSHVIPSLIRKIILYPEEDLTIFGDGKQQRAFIYVTDLVDGILLTMEKIQNGDVINLGGAELISIEDLADLIIKIRGIQIPKKYNLNEPQGTRRYCAYTKKMKEVLNWMPSVPFNEGLKLTYNWVARKLKVRSKINI